MHFRSEKQLKQHNNLHQRQCSKCHITFTGKREKMEHDESVHTIHWSSRKSRVSSVTSDHMYLAGKVDGDDHPCKTSKQSSGKSVEVAKIQKISRLQESHRAQAPTDDSSRSRQTSQKSSSTNAKPTSLPIPAASSLHSNMTVQVTEIQNTSRLPESYRAQAPTDDSSCSRHTTYAKPASLQIPAAPSLPSNMTVQVTEIQNFSRLPESHGVQTSPQSRQRSQQNRTTYTKPTSLSDQYVMVGVGNNFVRVPVSSEGVHQTPVTSIMPPNRTVQLQNMPILQTSHQIPATSTMPPNTTVQRQNMPVLLVPLQSSQIPVPSATTGALPSNMSVVDAKVQNISRLQVPPGAQAPIDISPQSKQTSQQRPATSTQPSNIPVQVAVKEKTISQISTEFSPQSSNTSQQRPVQFALVGNKLVKIPVPSKGAQTSTAISLQSRQVPTQSPLLQSLPSNVSVQYPVKGKNISKIPAPSERVQISTEVSCQSRQTSLQSPSTHSLPSKMMDQFTELRKKISSLPNPSGLSTHLTPQSGQMSESSQQQSSVTNMPLSNRSADDFADLRKNISEYYTSGKGKQKIISGQSKLPSLSTDVNPESKDDKVPQTGAAQNRTKKVQQKGSAGGSQSGRNLVDIDRMQSLKLLVNQQRINPVVSAAVVEFPGSYKQSIYYDPKDRCHSLKLSIPDNCIPTYAEVANVKDTDFFITVTWIPKTQNKTCELDEKKFVLKFQPGLTVNTVKEHKSTQKPSSFTIHLVNKKGLPFNQVKQAVSLFV